MILFNVKSEKDIVIDLLINNKPYIGLYKLESELETIRLWKSARVTAMKAFGITIGDIRKRNRFHREIRKKMESRKTPQAALDLVEKVKRIEERNKRDNIIIR